MLRLFLEKARVRNWRKSLRPELLHMNPIQERLRLVRGGTTQAEFASLNGLPLSTYSRYERGATAPDLDFLQSLCVKFDISPTWLLLGVGAMRATSSPETPSLPHAHNPEPTPQAACAHCAELEEELKSERKERRELATETRQLHRDKELLLREIGELREKVARLEERKRRYELTHGLAVEDRDVV